MNCLVIGMKSNNIVLKQKNVNKQLMQKNVNYYHKIVLTLIINVNIQKNVKKYHIIYVKTFHIVLDLKVNVILIFLIVMIILHKVHAILLQIILISVFGQEINVKNIKNQMIYMMNQNVPKLLHHGYLIQQVIHIVNQKNIVFNYH